MAGPSATWLARHRTLGIIAGTTLLVLLALAGDRLVHVPRGLVGRYFSNTDWQSRADVVRIAPELSTSQLDLAWNGAPPPRFSAVWDGFLFAPRTGDDTLATRSDEASLQCRRRTGRRRTGRGATTAATATRGPRVQRDPVRSNLDTINPTRDVDQRAQPLP